MNKEEKEFKHPSFGMLGFSRVDAKAEIDAAMQHAITKAGIKALGLQFNSDNKAIE